MQVVEQLCWLPLMLLASGTPPQKQVNYFWTSTTCGHHLKMYCMHALLAPCLSLHSKDEQSHHCLLLQPDVIRCYSLHAAPQHLPVYKVSSGTLSV